MRRTDKDAADADLARRQREHLERVHSSATKYHPSDCLHNHCPTCVGTGIDSNGRPCVHALSCPCSRCTSTMMLAPRAEPVWATGATT